MKNNPIQTSARISSCLRHRKPLLAAELSVAVLMTAGLLTAPAASTAWSGLGGNTDWATSGNWTNGVPGPTTDVFFAHDGTVNGPGIVNNQLLANRTVRSIQLLNTNASGFHVTQIDPGVTLIISNSTANAYSLWGGGVIGTVSQSAGYFQGQGILYINAPSGILSARFSQASTSGSGSLYTLNMSGLDTLTADLSRLYVGGDSGNRAQGALYLARTNIITLSYTAGPPLLLGNCGTGAAGGRLYLGMTNTFFADVGLWVGYRRASGNLIAFNPDSAIGGTAYFRNRAGTGRQNYWRIGDGSTQTYSGNSCIGTNDFSLGTVNAMIGDLIVGQNFSSAGGTSAGGASGVLRIAAGIIDVNNVNVATNNIDYGARAEGYIDVDGTAQLIVNNAMALGSFRKAADTNGVAKALLRIGTAGAGGSVVVKGAITTRQSQESQNWSEIVIQSGSLSAKNNIGPLNWLELTAGTLAIELDSMPTAPICSVSNLMTAAGFNLAISGAGLDVGPAIPIIKYWLPLYSGSGATDLTLTLPFYLEGYLTNNTDNMSIDLVVTKRLTTVWNGDKGNAWDVGLTKNWKDGTTGAEKFYSQNGIGDIVRFEDGAVGSGTVDLTTNLFPYEALVNNDLKAYTFTGTGRLTGTNGLSKSGAGSLTIANSGVNDFTGGISLNKGTLRIASADRLPIEGAISIADAAGTTLDLNNQDQAIAKLQGGGLLGGNITLGSGTLNVTGPSSFAGVISGTGKLVKSGSGTLTLSGPNTYSGGTTIFTNSTITVANSTGSGLGSGSVTVDQGATLRIGTGTANGSVAATAITNNGSVVFNLTNDFVLANALTGSGNVTKSGASTLMSMDTPNDFTGIFYIGDGVVRVSHPDAFGSTTSPDSSFSLSIPSTSGAHLQLSNNVALNETIRFSCKTGTLLTQPGIYSVNGTNVLNGPILLNSGGSTHNFTAAAGCKLIVNGPFSATDTWTTGFPYHCLGGDGDGEITSGFINGSSYSLMTNSLYKTGLGTWILSGSNAYAGFTVISNGTLVINGSILGTNPGPMPAGFFIGCAVRNAGTLAGNGLIRCVVTNEGTLSPGYPGVGTLTISNSLAMLGTSTNVFEIGVSGYDQVQGLTSVSYGGTLKVVLSRSLTSGESFKLFSASAYGGTFSALELPALSDSMQWDTNYLAVDGTLRVADASGIQITSSGIEPDGNIKIGGVYGTSSAGYRVFATTNVADASSWIEVSIGSFVNGAFNYTDLNSTNYPKRFYRIVTP